jgi:hypothetical protein
LAGEHHEALESIGNLRMQVPNPRFTILGLSGSDTSSSPSSTFSRLIHPKLLRDSGSEDDLLNVTLYGLRQNSTTSNLINYLKQQYDSKEMDDLVKYNEL